jgi:hypothetical protein
MGSSPSKGGSNKIEPMLSKSESWSTLDGFIASESRTRSPEAIAISTTVNDEEIKQVKTWMNFPERKPQSTLDLNCHLHQLKQKKSNIKFSDGASGVFQQGRG